MKLALDRSTLLKAMSHAQSVVEKRNTLPILSNVLIQADKKAVTIRATDLDIEIVEVINAAVVEEEGVTTVPAHMLYDIIKKIPDGAQISLEEKDGRLNIAAGRSKFTLATLPDTDFPSVGEQKFTSTYQIAAQHLQKLIDKVKFAIAIEETRHYLGGIYLHTADNALRSVATDGHRLARFDVSLPNGAENAPGVIVPRKTVTELRKLLDDPETSVTISVSETKIKFVCDGVTLTSRVIDGTFPDYTRVIPSNNTLILQATPDKLSSSVDRVSTVSSERTRAVKMSLNKDTLSLVVNSPEHGNAVEELDVSYNSDPLDIGFNAKYLQEIMNQIESDTAQFEFDSPTAPTLVRDPADESALYVIMPMRV
jgi:DNA polymerase-3 subunit beta